MIPLHCIQRNSLSLLGDWDSLWLQAKRAKLTVKILLRGAQNILCDRLNFTAHLIWNWKYMDTLPFLYNCSHFLHSSTNYRCPSDAKTLTPTMTLSTTFILCAPKNKNEWLQNAEVKTCFQAGFYSWTHRLHCRQLNVFPVQLLQRRGRSCKCHKVILSDPKEQWTSQRTQGSGRRALTCVYFNSFFFVWGYYTALLFLMWKT